MRDHRKLDAFRFADSDTSMRILRKTSKLNKIEPPDHWERWYKPFRNDMGLLEFERTAR